MSLDEQRSKVVTILSTKMKDVTATNYEKAIHKMCKKLCDSTGDELLDIYNKYGFDKVGELMLCDTREQRERVLADIKEAVIGFSSSFYTDVREEDEMEVRILTEGVKVKKGEITCKNPKCRSTECYYISKQTRGGDEATTIFTFCSKCDTRGKI